MKAKEEESSMEEIGLSNLLGYNPVWFWFMSLCVLVLLGVTIFVVKHLKTQKQIKQYLSFFNKEAYRQEMDHSYYLAQAEKISFQEGYRRATLLLKAYVQNTYNVPATTMTLSQLKNSPDLPVRLHQQISNIYPALFSDKVTVNLNQYTLFMNECRQFLDEVDRTPTLKVVA